jgi:hypothetical protein
MLGYDSRTLGIRAQGLEKSLHTALTRISADFTCVISGVKSTNGKYGTCSFFCVLFGGVWPLCVVLSPTWTIQIYEAEALKKIK